MKFNHILLADYPKTFEALAGLSPEAFATLVEEIRPLDAAETFRRKQRSNRVRVIGGGRPFALSLDDAILAVLVAVRFREPFAIGLIFGVSKETVRQTMLRLKPLLSASTAASLLTPLPLDEMRKRFLLAVNSLPNYGGIVRVLGSRCRIWVDDAGKIWSGGQLLADLAA